MKYSVTIERTVYEQAEMWIEADSKEDAETAVMGLYHGDTIGDEITNHFLENEMEWNWVGEEEADLMADRTIELGGGASGVFKYTAAQIINDIEDFEQVA